MSLASSPSPLPSELCSCDSSCGCCFPWGEGGLEVGVDGRLGALKLLPITVS